ncbi:MAG: PHP domain-containing protein [Lachnospiraceae bacterium]|nr:PHP domain-containing protein [Lachnospiraceae bacterium]
MNNNLELIDLHVHSNASDGSLTPSEVAEEAIKAGLKAIALTDHDTVDGIPEILEYTKDKPLEIVPGVELSCYYNNREIHILGFYGDYSNPKLHEALQHLSEQRKNRNIQMVELMQRDGLNVTMEKLLHGNPNSVITRAHFARVLVEEGICKDKEVAFKKYIGVGCKYYLPKPKITCEMAMDILNKYFKASFLAHPLLYKMGYAQIEELIVYLKSLGLNGIEAFHSSNNIYESDKLRSMAIKHDLLISGGSDFHGIIKPNIKLGVGRGGMKIQKYLLDKIKEL